MILSFDPKGSPDSSSTSMACTPKQNNENHTVPCVLECVRIDSKIQTALGRLNMEEIGIFSKKGAHVLWNKMNLLFTTPQELISEASCKLCTRCLNKKIHKQTLSTSYPYHNLQCVKSQCLRQSALCCLGVSGKPTKKLPEALYWLRHHSLMLGDDSG